MILNFGVDVLDGLYRTGVYEEIKKESKNTSPNITSERIHCVL